LKRSLGKNMGLNCLRQVIHLRAPKINLGGDGFQAQKCCKNLASHRGSTTTEGQGDVVQTQSPWFALTNLKAEKN